MKVLIRPDAGLEMGLGHLQRCLNLAYALKQCGFSVEFISYSFEEVEAIVEAEGYRFEHLVDGYPAGIPTELLDRFKVLLIDSYNVSMNELRNLKRGLFYLAIIDDLCMEYPFADLVINANPYALENNPKNTETIYLFGPQYALLRPEFSNIQQKKIRTDINDLLITLGGSDPWNLTPVIVESVIKTLGDRLKIHVIIGPFFNNKRDIIAQCRSLGRNVLVYLNPPNIERLMFKADLAISAGGQTLFELAAVGTPTIVIQLADNQKQNIQILKNKGAVMFAGEVHDFNLERSIAEKLIVLLEKPGLREKIAFNARKLFDGKGIYRVAEKIKEVTTYKQV